jgi:lipid A 3-O-deacylase
VTVLLAILIAATVPGETRFELDDDSPSLSFGLLPGSDHYYTEGARLQWMSPGERVHENWLPLVKPTNAAWGVALGQTMYTPNSIDVPLLQPYDRPYGAWLFGGLIGRFFWLEAKNPSDLPAILTVGLDVGVIGPWALGYYFQTGAHWVLRGFAPDGDPPDPKGWGYQIGRSQNLVGANLHALWQRWILRGCAWDVQVEAKGELGNVFVRGGGGLVARFGWLDSGVPAILEEIPHLTNDSQPAPGEPPRRDWELYVTLKAEPQLVGWNLFVEGTADSHGLSAAPVIVDFEGGLAFRFKRFLIGWTYSSRSRETRDALPIETGAATRPRLFAHQFVRIQIAWLDQ